MKKLIFLISLLVACFTVSAQESSTYDYPLGYDNTFMEYTSAAAATTATDSLWYYTVKKESKMAMTYDVTIALDSVSGTNHRTVVTLLGKNWPVQSTWTTITSKAWIGGHDTVINLTEATTAKQYRYWKTQVKSDLKGFVFKVTNLDVKLWEK